MLSDYFHALSQLSPFLFYLKPQEVPACSKIFKYDQVKAFMFARLVKLLNV